MGRVNGHTAEQVIEAIHKAHGLPSIAAQMLGIGHSTFYTYVNRYPTIKKALNDERDIWIDVAESELQKLVRKGNITAIMFFLKTVGRVRGYVERTENLNVNLDNLSDDQLQEFINGKDLNNVLSKPE